MSEAQEALPGVNILSIDGGAAGGLASLIVLNEIMNRLQNIQKSNKPPIPANQFDLIAGTGTGGISACMLGRLGMPINKALDEYGKLVKIVFSEKKRLGSTVYKKTKLQQALRSMVREITGDEEEPMLRKEIDGDKCKTVVFAMAKKNMRACLPVLFRSYRAATNTGPDCTIWEALHATIAHPDLFKSIEIGTSWGQQSFVGGELGCSNPISHVLSEAKRLYPNRHVACILSIGAGRARIIRVPDPSVLHKVIRIRDTEAARQMAIDSERLADEMAVRFTNTSGVYFRFNVDRETPNTLPKSSKQLDEIADAQAYLRMSGVAGAVERAARRVIRMLGGTLKLITTHVSKYVDGQVPQRTEKRPPQLKRCPAPTPVYTGCIAESNQVESCITDCGDDRNICVIFGLGGVGKTQLALNVIQRTRNKWDHIIYVDASSLEAIENALRDLAISKGLGETYMDAINWLGFCPERWLLVLDGADDRSIEIRGLTRYIPNGGRGSVIITTRLTRLTMLARGPGSICRLSKMRPEDALTLLLKTARLDERNLSESEVKAANALLEDFGYLAFAVVHAGAYIGHVRSISIGKYRDLFLSKRRCMLEQSGELQRTVDGYDKTIPMTWKMCYELVDERSRPMLWLIAFLHPDNIHEDIFKQAASNMRFRGDVVPLTEVERVARGHVRWYLSTFLGPEGCWDSVRFTNVMADLASCSLIDFDQNNSTYNVHVLVQDWIGTVIPQPAGLALECAMAVLSMSIDEWGNSDAESLTFQRKLGPHIDNAMKRGYEIGITHVGRFAHVCFQTGRWKQANLLEERLLTTYKKLLGDEHPATIYSMNELVLIHLSLGQWETARQMGVTALEMCKQARGEEDPLTMKTMTSLSVSYMHLGRWSEAEQLLGQALDAYQYWLGEDHQATLQIKSYLASTYSCLGQWAKAEQLGTQVLVARGRVLGETHPDTLETMNNLVSIYLDLGRWDEAQRMQKQVYHTYKEVLGQGHPHTIACMSKLASIHSFLGQWDAAEKLGSQVLAARKQILGDEHPDTLESMNNLASAYSRLGQQDKANQLLVQALHAHERLLGKEHPRTLTIMGNIAANYSHLGRWDEAEKLGTQVLAARIQILGEDHPDMLVTAGNVAVGHALQGRWDEAEQLQLQVLDVRKRILGEDHPHTLRGMGDLAVTYAHLDRGNDAELLLANAISTLRRKLGDQHPDIRLYEANMVYIKMLGYLKSTRFRSFGILFPFALLIINIVIFVWF